MRTCYHYTHVKLQKEVDPCCECVIEFLEKQRDELLEALRELTALVRGECPSLLSEDSGGDANLSLRIDDLLTSTELQQAAL